MTDDVWEVTMVLLLSYITPTFNVIMLIRFTTSVVDTVCQLACWISAL